MTNLLFDRSQQQGRLELVDRDRLDLLHRMSTNDFQNLQPGEGRSTVLTTALARIIDRVIVYNRGETALLVTNQPAVVRAWLQKHIFFQDKVKIRDVSSVLGQLELYGPQAVEFRARFAPGVRHLPLHHFIETELLGQSALIAKSFPLGGEGYSIIIAADAIDTLKAEILKSADIMLGDDSQYERLRIQAGLPGAGHELTEDYIPLEANLWDSVSFTKGCYIGQEIIARMESRNRLAKTLTRLHLDAVAPLGATLMSSDRKVGTLTSIATLDDGSVLGLGFVKPDIAESAATLDVVVDEQVTAQAEIADPEYNGMLPTERKQDV